MGVLVAEKLMKSYGKKKAVNLSCRINAGKIIGLIGKNGAGKTTFMQLCMGLLKPSSGSLKVLDTIPFLAGKEFFHQIGFIPDTPKLDGWMNIGELFDFMKSTHSNWDEEKAASYIEKAELSLKTKIKGLSRGMQTQLYLFLLLSRKTRLMLLDEPTLGLDPMARKTFRDVLLQDYFDEKRTVIISTHQIKELEDIIDEIIFLEKGEIICHESVQSIKERFCMIRVHNSQVDEIGSNRLYKMQGLLEKTFFLIHNSDLKLIHGDISETQEPEMEDIFAAFVDGGLR
jgi:ABC-2 type transport system ATP-binding protein